MSGFFVVSGTSSNRVAWVKDNAIDWQPSAGKDSRAGLSGLEGHPVFPVVPGVHMMATGDWNAGPQACKNFIC